MVILRDLGLAELPSETRARPSGRRRHWQVAFVSVASSLATSTLILLGAVQLARAQSTDVENDVKGTACEAPKDESTNAACTTAILDCAFVTMYGRTSEEKDRLYKGCIRKIVARYKAASDAAGDAVRREFSDGPEDRAAAKAAARQKAQAQAAAAALQAKKQKEPRLTEQERADAVRQACSRTGFQKLEVVGTAFVDGSKFGVPSSWAYDGQIVQPIGDTDAVASGKCSVDFKEGNQSDVGRIDMGSLKPSGTQPAQAVQ